MNGHDSSRVSELVMPRFPCSQELSFPDQRPSSNSRHLSYVNGWLWSSRRFETYGVSIPFPSRILILWWPISRLSRNLCHVSSKMNSSDLVEKLRIVILCDMIFVCSKTLIPQFLTLSRVPTSILNGGRFISTLEVCYFTRLGTFTYPYPDDQNLDLVVTRHVSSLRSYDYDSSVVPGFSWSQIHDSWSSGISMNSRLLATYPQQMDDSDCIGVSTMGFPTPCSWNSRFRELRYPYAFIHLVEISPPVFFEDLTPSQLLADPSAVGYPPKIWWFRSVLLWG